MSFVLVSTTRGDDLIAPERKVVATSDDRETLESERDRRSKERSDWLEKNDLPWWSQASIISSETIEEVPSL